MTVEAVCVYPPVVEKFWPFCRDMILAAMVRGGISEFTDVQNSVLNGDAFLWVAWDGEKILAAAVTRIDVVNAAKIGTIVACGGSDLKRFGDLRLTLEQHFRDEGCLAARICGRRGWLKHYPDYKVKSVIMEKAL